MNGSGPGDAMDLKLMFSTVDGATHGCLPKTTVKAKA